ncbi:MAG: GNAT family N-acetyltransferase, partial [Oscillospiraceae bacterium]
MSILKTERLILRPFRETDAEAMFRNWTSDECVAEHCRWFAHEDISVTEQLLKMYMDEAEKGFEYRWAITLRDKDEPVGVIDIVG